MRSGYEIDAAFEREIQQRCWSPWQRATGFVKTLITLVKLVALIGGAWYAHSWFPHTLVENQLLYWGGFLLILNVYWMVLNLVTGTANPDAPDAAEWFMSPVGKHVWNNLLEYDIITNIVASKLKR